MYIVRLLHGAEIELAEALEWYEEQQKGLAKRFFKEFDYYLVLLRKNPFQFNVRFLRDIGSPFCKSFLTRWLTK